jgi:hypothetical protein
MDFTTLLDEDQLSDELCSIKKEARAVRSRKRFDRARKGRKPSRPAGHMGQRSNKRLKNI